MSYRIFAPSATRGLLFSFLALAAACGDPVAPIAVATVVVTPADQTLHSLGDTVQLTAVARDAEGNVIEGRTVTFTSGAPAFVAVDGNRAVAVANGEATVTASVDGISGSTTVFVEQVVTTVEVRPAEVRLKSLGEIAHFTATPRDARGNAVEGKVLAWTTSAPAIAAANTSGGVMAMANGNATFTASVDGISGTGSVNVTQTAVKLGFATQPVTMQNGIAIPSLVVEVRDSLDHVVRGAANTILVDFAANPAAGTLSGTRQLAAVDGVVNFSSLAIDKPAVGYALSASAAGLTGATTQAFEIMNVPIRLDSLTLASTNLKIGGSGNYTAWITNGEGKNALQVSIQANILQGNFTNAAGGSSVFTCGGGTGVVTPGTCKVTLSYNSTIGVFVAGAANARFDMSEGQTLRGTVSKPITMVP